MRDEITQWKNRIEKTPLPILKSTAQFFAKQKSKPGTSVSGLWSCLQYDLGMCLNLLRAAGRSKSAKVTNLNHAILLLGLPNTLSRTDNLPKIEDIKDKEVRRQYLTIYNQCFHTYSISQSCFSLNQEEVNKENQIACFMTGFIDYLICNADFERYVKLIKKQQQGLSLIEAEKNVLGVTRRELAFEIASDWHLPELVIQSQKHDKNPTHNLQHVYLTLRLKEALSLGWYHQDMDKVINLAAEFISKPAELVTREIHRASINIERISQNIYPDTPGIASRLLECEPAKVSSKKAVPMPQQMTHKEFYEQSLKYLQQKDHQTYQAIISECFNGFQKGLGFTRMFFAVLTEDKKHLKVIISQTIANKQSFNRFRMPLNNKNLFAQLMLQPGGVWMNKINQKKYSPFLPAIFLEEVRSHNFVAMSAFIHEHPFGLFFADMNATKELSEKHFKYFKHLCRISSEAFERLSDQQEKLKIA